MRFCSNCGKEIPENAKFCPFCGYRVAMNRQNGSNIENSNFEDKKDSVPLDITEDISNKKKTDINLLYKIVLIFVVLLVASMLFFKYKNNVKSFSKAEEIKKIVGEWYDPTGIIISKGDIITLKQQGNDIVGTNRKDNISIYITPVGVNHYSGHLIIYGINSNNDVKYDEKSRKLIFVNILLKSELNIYKKGN